MNKQLPDTIAYCGLDCAECFAYKLTVSEAAKSLRREMRTAKLKETWQYIPFLSDYEGFKKSLDGLAKLRCTKQCRGGGGNPWCKIRICCRKKGLDGCWICADFETCGKLTPRFVAATKKVKRHYRVI